MPITTPTTNQNPPALPNASNFQSADAYKSALISSGADPKAAAQQISDMNKFGFNPTSWNPVTTANTPATSGFNSSAQVGVNTQTAKGLTNATSGIINGGSPTQQPTQQPQPAYGGGGMYSGSGNTPLSNTQQFMYGAAQGGYQSGVNAYSQAYNLQLQNAQLANSAIGLQYDTALGNLNQQYNQAFQTLQTQHMNTIGSSIAQMSQADPMGIQNSSFASGYVGKVNDMFAQQSTFLTNAYNQQQVALQNGKAQAAIQIQQQINSAQAQFSSSLAQLNQGLASQMASIAQFGQQQQSMSTAYFDSILKFSNLSGVDPNSTPEQLQQQFPSLFQLGQQAGLPSDAIAQSIKQGTISQANLNISANRLQLEGLQTQADLARTYNVSNTLQMVNGVGNMPSSPDTTQATQYYNSLVGATAGSLTAPSAQTTDKMAAIQTSVNLLPLIQGAVNNLKDTSSIANYIASKDIFKPFSTNSTSFEGMMQTVAGTLDKALGTTLSDSISRTMEAGDTAATRQAVYNMISHAVASTGLNTIDSAARRAENVSGYSSVVPTLVDLQSQTAPTQAPTSQSSNTQSQGFQPFNFAQSWFNNISSQMK